MKELIRKLAAMQEVIRKLTAMLDKMPEDINVISIYDSIGEVFLYKSVKKLADIFGTEVTISDRDSEEYPFRHETVIDGIVFYEIRTEDFVV